MTGFLNINTLRAHAVARDLWDERGRWNNQRPQLVSDWHVAPDGRLACRWRVDDGTEPGPSG